VYSGLPWQAIALEIIVTTLFLHGTEAPRLKVHFPSCGVLVVNDNPYGLMFSLSLI
jgi:hypothetical protein